MIGQLGSGHRAVNCSTVAVHEMQDASSIGFWRDVDEPWMECLVFAVHSIRLMQAGRKPQ